MKKRKVRGCKRSGKSLHRSVGEKRQNSKGGVESGSPGSTQKEELTSHRVYGRGLLPVGGTVGIFICNLGSTLRRTFVVVVGGSGAAFRPQLLLVSLFLGHRGTQQAQLPSDPSLLHPLMLLPSVLMDSP